MTTMLFIGNCQIWAPDTTHFLATCLKAPWRGSPSFSQRRSEALLSRQRGARVARNVGGKFSLPNKEKPVLIRPISHWLERLLDLSMKKVLSKGEAIHEFVC
jgi:hypothetical protein